MLRIGLIYTKKGVRKRWDVQQKKIMEKYFQKYIRKKQAPSKSDCLKFKEKYPKLFADRDWVTIKTFVYNCYRIQ